MIDSDPHTRAVSEPLVPLRPLVDAGDQATRTQRADPRRALLVGGLIGLVVGLLGVFAFRGWMRLVVQFVEPAAFLSGVVVGMAMALVVHEAGHVSAGVATGWRFVFAIIGPIGVSGVDGFRLRRNTNIAFMGGMALAAPTRWEGFETFRRKHMAMIAGGPVASVTLAIVGAAVAFVVSADATPRSLQAGLAFVFAAVAVCSALIAVATLVPSHMGPVASDGLQLLRLWRSTGSDAAATALRICQLHCTWVRPRDWPPITPLGETGGLTASEQAFLSMCAALVALDTARPGEARRHTAEALRRVATATALAAPVEVPQYEAFAATVAAVTGTVDEAEALLGSARAGAGVSPSSLTMAEACIASARGCHEEARALADRALTQHAAAPLPVGGATYLPFIDWIDSRAADARGHIFL